MLEPVFSAVDGGPPVRSRSLLWSFNYAIQGIVYALRTQRNMRLHALAAATVLIASLFFRITALELIALVFAIGLVLVAELVNTAVEATIDLTIDRIDPLAKTAKDVAAGAVLVASVIAVVVGFVVFFNPLASWADTLFARVSGTPVYLTVVALGLTSLAVLATKAFSRSGTFMSGGWPSGHTAIATAVAAIIGYTTHSAKAMVLALFVAALVAQSRVEADAHTIPQVVLGALLGFLTATAVFQVFLR
jgi:diacylglycerol kinase (ATP)